MPGPFQVFENAMKKTLNKYIYKLNNISNRPLEVSHYK